VLNFTSIAQAGKDRGDVGNLSYRETAIAAIEQLLSLLHTFLQHQYHARAKFRGYQPGLQENKSDRAELGKIK
jgi:hypothetical protein